MTPSIMRSPAVLAGAASLVLLAGCGTQAYTPPAAGAQSPVSGSAGSAQQSSATGPTPAASPAAPQSQAQSQRSIEAERAQVAKQYWPATSVIMKAVPGMEQRLGIQLRFEQAVGTFTSCATSTGGNGLQYQVAVVIEASGHKYEDLGPPLGQAARIAEHDLTAVGWGPFTVSQGVTVAGEHAGVSASFDNDPAATETDTSFATALVYDLAGACIAVPGSAAAPPGGGSQAGGGPDAGPPPGTFSAGDGLPPVRDSYGLGPATLAPLGPVEQPATSDEVGILVSPAGPAG